MPPGFLVKADAKNVGLTPAVVNFFLHSLSSFEEAELSALAYRLTLAAITDPQLAMASEEYPQKGAAFRNEVMYMGYIIQVWLGEIEIPDKCEERFGNWVKEIAGAAIDNPEVHAKIIRNLGAPKANKDATAFKLATGRLMSQAACKRIEEAYHPVVDSVVDDVASTRLGRIMAKASESCIFSKIGVYTQFTPPPTSNISPTPHKRRQPVHLPILSCQDQRRAGVPPRARGHSVPRGRRAV